jgi:hypothetical protein
VDLLDVQRSQRQLTTALQTLSDRIAEGISAVNGAAVRPVALEAAEDLLRSVAAPFAAQLAAAIDPLRDDIRTLRAAYDGSGVNCFGSNGALSVSGDARCYPASPLPAASPRSKFRLRSTGSLRQESAAKPTTSGRGPTDAAQGVITASGSSTPLSLQPSPQRGAGGLQEWAATALGRANKPLSQLAEWVHGSLSTPRSTLSSSPPIAATAQRVLPGPAAYEPGEATVAPLSTQQAVADGAEHPELYHPVLRAPAAQVGRVGGASAVTNISKNPMFLDLATSSGSGGGVCDRGGSGCIRGDSGGREKIGGGGGGGGGTSSVRQGLFVAGLTPASSPVSPRAHSVRASAARPSGRCGVLPPTGGLGWGAAVVTAAVVAAGREQALPEAVVRSGSAERRNRPSGHTGEILRAPPQPRRAAVGDSPSVGGIEVLPQGEYSGAPWGRKG